jgi:hypothetical protein
LLQEGFEADLGSHRPQSLIHRLISQCLRVIVRGFKRGQDRAADPALLEMRPYGIRVDRVRRVVEERRTPSGVLVPDTGFLSPWRSIVTPLSTAETLGRVRPFRPQELLTHAVNNDNRNRAD